MTALPTLYVSRYSNKAIAELPTVAPIRFTRGHPRWRLPYTLAGAVMILAPTRQEFALGDDHDAFTTAYRHRLDQLDHLDIAAQIQTIIDARNAAGTPTDSAVMLCYEDVRTGDLCHRSIFADWWHDRTGEVVAELPNPDPVKAAKPKRQAKPQRGPTTLQLTLL